MSAPHDPGKDVTLDFCGEDSYAVYSAHAVDAARAADAERHQAEIERLNAKIRGLKAGEELSRHYHDSVRREFDLPDPSTNAIVDRLRVEIAEIATLRATVDQQQARITEFEARCATLTAALEELYATVKGECPSLLNEDSGGSAQLDAQVSAALAATPQGDKA